MYSTTWLSGAALEKYEAFKSAAQLDLPVKNCKTGLD